MRIPVLWREGRWMLQYDAPIQFREGTVGELRVDHVESTDRDYLAAADERYKIAFLAEDAELRIALTIKTDLDEDLMPLLLEYSDTSHNTMAPISCQSRFVSVRLRPETAPTLLPDEGSGGLCFVFRGMDLVRVQSGLVELPNVRGLQAVPSLNQAITRLSEVFEPWRKAHTGSIYERVFYCEPDGRWAQLEDLRQRAIQARWSESWTI